MQKRCSLRRTLTVFLEVFSSSTLGYVRERAVADRAFALNLEVLGRSLTPVGDLFVFDGLPFIERRKTSFLNCRNMNEHVLAAIRGLDEPVALGWIEPLHRTFSHSRRLRGIKKSNRAVGPRTNRHARGLRIRGLGQAG